MTLKVVATQFTKRGRYGDYLWMITQPEYKKSLFVFNDDEEHMNSHAAGGGNACVRPFNFLGYTMQGLNFPRSAGIPTGRCRRGYRDIEEGQLSIDFAVQRIRELISKHKYDKLYFSVGDDGYIGCRIFHVPSPVREYISCQIWDLGI